MIRQCAILFGCLALGELIVFLTGIKLPSSIIGMLLLTLFLKLGWIKLHWVQGMSDFLVANLGFFFIPPGVALMLYFDIIAAEFWPIAIASLVSTLLVLVVTGWVHQLTRKSNELFRKRILPAGYYFRDILLSQTSSKEDRNHAAESHLTDYRPAYHFPEDDKYQL